MTVEVMGYENAPVGEFWADNRLIAEIGVRAGPFQGKVPTTILTSDLINFLAELRPVFETLCGSAQFETGEGRLHVRLTAHGASDIEVLGEAADPRVRGNRLHFALRFGQFQLGESIRELEQVAARFPVRN